VRQAQATRNGHIQALLDMQRNNNADGAVGSAIAKLIDIALRQHHAAWWLCYGRRKHTGTLLAELAGRLCEAGRMDLELLSDLVREVRRLRHRVVSGRTDLTLGL
jgi:hypothetical protein